MEKEIRKIEKIRKDVISMSGGKKMRKGRKLMRKADSEENNWNEYNKTGKKEYMDKKRCLCECLGEGKDGKYNEKNKETQKRDRKQKIEYIKKDGNRRRRIKE